MNDASIAATPSADAALSTEDDDAEAAHTPSGKQRSMLPVMIVLSLASLGFIGYQALNTIAGVRLLLAGNDYNRGLISDYEMDDIYRDINALSLSPTVTGIIALTTVIAFLWFNVRAVSNLRAFSLRHVPASPLGVVLWQFVPTLNLVKPYSIMMLLWSRSREHAGEPSDPPALAFWWWITWLAGLAFVSLSRILDVTDMENARSGLVETIPMRALGLATLSSACLIASTLAMLAITWGLARTQDNIRQGRVAVDLAFA